MMRLSSITCDPWSPRPGRCSSGRRRNPPVSPSYRPSIYLAVIFLIISSCVSSLATAISTDDRPTVVAETPQVEAETTLLIDPRIPVQVNGHWRMMSRDDHRRNLARDSDGLRAETFVLNPHALSSDDDDGSKSLPTVFDGALAANFSGANNGACPAFINHFLSDEKFQSCYPLSLLMQSSVSFFQAQKSFVGITQVLDATCAADVDSCTTYFNDLADTLISDEKCADDYASGNSIVVQSYIAFKAYAPIYSASCLTEGADSSSYCYAQAVTDSGTVDDVRLYYLPLNITLSEVGNLTCNDCTSKTVDIFRAAAADRSNFIANTYGSAAAEVNGACGTDFVQASLPEATTGSSFASRNVAAPASSFQLIALPLLAVMMVQRLFS